MAALLDERAKRQRNKSYDLDRVQTPTTKENPSDNLHSLVERVKRKSTAIHGRREGKRQRV